LILFDAATILLTSVVDVFGELIAALIEFISGAWKPLSSVDWNFLTNMDLSIINALTIPIAFALNIIAKIKHGALPFDSSVWTDPSAWLPTKESFLINPQTLSVPKSAGTPFSKPALDSESPTTLPATAESQPVMIESLAISPQNLSVQQSASSHPPGPRRITSHQTSSQRCS
jgi:hypothetical protein